MQPSRTPTRTMLALAGWFLAGCSDATDPRTSTLGAFTRLNIGLFSCALTPASVIGCWGETVGEPLAPTRKTLPDGVKFQSITVGNSACGLTTAGAAYCWGLNDRGQLGDGTVSSASIPVPVLMPPGVAFTDLAMATGTFGAHACGLSADGVAYCWGANDSGQLGDNTTASRGIPGAVAMPAGVKFISLGVGAKHSCGLTVVGGVWCWGDNEEASQLGDGTSADRLIPTQVTMPPGIAFASVSISGYHGCGLTAGGAAYCWGWNSRGQIGDGTQSSRSVPTAIVMPAGVSFTSIDAGYYNTCALSAGGIAYCWGRNVFGEVGDGSTATQHLAPVPVAMPVGVTFTSVVAGWNHACGLSAAGQAWCWGMNSRGQLGDGTTINRSTPVKVVQ